MLVCINPAHVMATPGKYTPPYEDGSIIDEVEQNYPVAFELERQLKHNGIGVVMTERDMNKPLPPKGNYSSQANADMYNRIHFEQESGCDLYVSIHKDADSVYKWTETNGTTVYIYGLGGNAEKAAYKVINRLIEYSGDKNRGVKVANLAEVRETYAPAILLELGFMTNRQDADRMLNADWQYIYACGAAHGICEYFGVQYNQLAMEKPNIPQYDAYIAELKAISSNIRALCNDMDTIIRHF